MMHCINLMSISFSVKSSQKDFHRRIVSEITFQWSVVEYEVLKNVLIFALSICLNAGWIRYS